MKTKEIILFGAITLFSFSSEAFAQTAMGSKTDSIKLSTSTEQSGPKIVGFINARYQNTNKGYVSGKNDFDIKNAIIDLTGNYCKTINYRVRFDLAGTPALLDAYAEWKPLKYIGLQVGQFQLPYTFENQYVPKTLECVDNAQVISNLVFNASKGRDAGISINGSFLPKTGFNLIEYKLAAINGNGFNKADDNSALDLLGSLFINPIKPLSIVASYLSGKTSVVTAPSTIPSNVVDKERTAFGVKYDDGKALLRAEYIKGTTAGIDALGYYAVAGYFVTKEIQPILKYDYYQSDKSIDNTGTTQYVAGVNYWMASKTRVLLSYNYAISNNTAVKNVGLLTAGLIVAF